MERVALVAIDAGELVKPAPIFIFPFLAQLRFSARVGEFLKLPRNRSHIRWRSKNNCIGSQKFVPSSGIERVAGNRLRCLLVCQRRLL